MKHIKYLLLLLLIFPIKVMAFGIDIGCNTIVQANKEFTCTISGPEWCTEAQLELELPNGFNLKNNVAGKNYSSIGEGTLIKYSGNGVHDRIMSVLTITAPNVNSTFTLKFKNIKFKYLATEKEYNTKEDVSINITVQGATSNDVSSTTKSTTTTTVTTNNITVTLNSNGSSGEDQSLSCTLNNSKCEVNLDGATIPIREGYVFKGWGVTKDCTQGVIGNYEVIADTVLYACWESSNPNIDALPYLDSLTVEGYELNFSKYNLEYDINVLETVDTLNINAKAVSSNATVSINKPETLQLGLNKITIIVQDGEQSLTYTINVIKGNNASTDNISLANVTIENYKLAFDSGIYIYDVIIDKNTKELKFNVTTSNETDNYEIIGNSDLKDGSVVIIRVTSGTSSVDYKFNIKVKSFIKDYLKYIIAACILLFMLLVYFIFKMKQDPTKKEQKNNVVNTKDTKNTKKSKETKTSKKKEKTSGNSKSTPKTNKSPNAKEDTKTDLSEPIETLETL